MLPASHKKEFGKKFIYKVERGCFKSPNFEYISEKLSSRRRQAALPGPVLDGDALVSKISEIEKNFKIETFFLRCRFVRGDGIPQNSSSCKDGEKS